MGHTLGGFAILTYLKRRPIDFCSLQECDLAEDDEMTVGTQKRANMRYGAQSVWKQCTLVVGGELEAG